MTQALLNRLPVRLLSSYEPEAKAGRLNSDSRSASSAVSEDKEIPRSRIPFATGKAVRAARCRAARVRPASDLLTGAAARNHLKVSELPEVLLSRLQPAFELIEKSPIGALGDELLRARLYQPRFVQAQRVKPERVLVIVFAPFVVRNLGERLEGVVVARREAAIDDEPRRPGRL